jgi:hypothetical protein
LLVVTELRLAGRQLVLQITSKEMVIHSFYPVDEKVCHESEKGIFLRKLFGESWKFTEISKKILK